MRLIIKPAGLAVIAVSIAVLAGIALSKQSKGGSVVKNQDAIAAPATSSTSSGSGQSGAPDPSVTSKTLDTAPTAGGSGDVIVASSHETELMPSPKIASEDWKAISPKEGTDLRVFPCTLPQFPKLKRATVTKLPQNPWDLQIRQTAKGEIPLGAHVHVRVWARSRTNSPMTVACEHNEQPYEKLASKSIDLTPDWKQYDLEWTSDRTAPASWAQISLQLGGKVGEIELAGASLIASTSTAK